jgi:hypothetical protein
MAEMEQRHIDAGNDIDLKLLRAAPMAPAAIAGVQDLSGTPDTEWVSMLVAVFRDEARTGFVVIQGRSVSGLPEANPQAAAAQHPDEPQDGQQSARGHADHGYHRGEQEEDRGRLNREQDRQANGRGREDPGP